MKHFLSLIVAITISFVSFSQKKEKIKGSQIITLTTKQVESFDTIDIADNLEVFLVPSDTNAVEIEADDNLHDIVVFEIIGATLKLHTTKDVIKAKKFSVRINYTNNLKLVIAKDEVVLNALAELTLDNITIKNFDRSKSFLNVKSGMFSLFLNNKSQAEINSKSDKIVLELSDTSLLKALVNTKDFKLNMYQKTRAEIEGEAKNANIRLDNNASLKAKKLAIDALEITTEMYASCEINVKNQLKIAATGKSEIEFLGDANVTLETFKNNALLRKVEK